MVDKYLKQDKKGNYYTEFEADHPIIDCHIHMSNLLPGKQVCIREDVGPPKHLTLPPVSELDLSMPYWTKKEYLIKKYKSSFAVLGYGLEGYKIFKDMLRGTYENYLVSALSCKITSSIILPISTSRSDLSKNAIKNAETYSEFIPFMSVHPSNKDALDKITHYKLLGAVGLKLKMTSSELTRHYDSLLVMMKQCDKLDLPVLFHTGSILLDQNKISNLSKKLLNSTHVSMFETLLEDMPKSFKFIFGHAGISSYKEVARLMKQYPSTYAELSSQSTDSIKYLIDHIGSKRLLFGSDWPALPQALTLSRVLHATEDNHEARENILYRNAEDLFNLK